MLLCGNFYAQELWKLRSLSLKGNEYLSANTILTTLSLKEGMLVSDVLLEVAAKKILEVYRTDGYLDASVDTILLIKDTTFQAVDVVFVFSEGKQSVIRSLQWGGDSIFPPTEMQTITTLHEGDVFRPGMLEADLYGVLKHCDEKGYPFAVVSLEAFECTELEKEIAWKIVLKLEKQAQVQLADMRIEGLKTTKEDVVRRAARIQPYQIYTADIPPQVQRRLERLRIFSTVTEPTLYLSNRTTDTLYSGGLKVQVEEGRLLTFDGMIGYVPSSSVGARGTITGLISLRFENLFGTARKFSLRWFRERAMTQEVELGYTEPWLFSLPLNSTVHFFQRRQDSTYIRNSFDFSTEYMFSEEFSIAGSFSVNTAYGIEGYGRQIIPESKTIAFGASLKYDTRNNTHTPTEGLYYFTEYATGRKIQSALAGMSATKNAMQRVVADASYYQRIVTRQVMVFDAHLRSILSSALTLSDLYLLGGATTLRGYREGQFWGSRIFWFTTEYRFLVTPRSFFFFFGDVGYYITPAIESSRTPAVSGKPYGYGGGVRFETAVGFLGVTIAFGKGDTFGTAKLHVRLSNEF